MLKPIGYRVLVRPDGDGLEKDDSGHYKSDGGILIMDSVVEKDRAHQVYGTLVAMGPTAFKKIGGRESSPEECGVKLGMRVSFSKYGGAFIDDLETKQRLIVLNDEDLLTSVQEDTNE